ncbi:DUF951 domain-containing protein [Mycoplasmatota bacterium]|nr:DUF951 domain-containing protein [Mycoplasmatota bacterium]
MDIKLNDIVVLKKGHACGANLWKIVRFGADVKLECQECKRIIMMPRVEVKKKVKKVIELEE